MVAYIWILADALDSRTLASASRQLSKSSIYMYDRLLPVVLHGPLRVSQRSYIVSCDLYR